jgi:hypothetical protein
MAASLLYGHWSSALALRLFRLYLTPGQSMSTQYTSGPMRYAGLDITVYESADKRPPGHLSCQGPEALRWALYEVAQSATRSSSPDRAYYLEVKQRLNHKRACLSVARKICRRAHHILRRLGDEAFAPVHMSVLPSFERPVLETA